MFPLSNWTELDIWQYIGDENIELPSIYYAHRRDGVPPRRHAAGVSPCVTLGDGEEPFEALVRFRTVGDATAPAPSSRPPTRSTRWWPRWPPPASPSAAPPAPTTASPRPAWKTASARGISRHGIAQVCNGRIGRRRQVHAHRAAAVRLEGDLRGPARGRRALQCPDGRRVHQPGPAHRRPAGRARAGHHHRRRLPLLRHTQAEVHHRRHPRPHPVHAQHGHRGIDGRPGARADRCPQGRARAIPPARVPCQPARYPAPGPVREQDGPGRLVRGALRGDQGRVPELRHEARRARPHLRADLRPARRQRRAPLRQHGLVRGLVAAAPPRRGAHRERPQPHRRPLPRAVRPAAAPWRAPRLPGLRRHGGERRAQAR